MNIQFNARIFKLYQIWLSNLFLQIITLFIYRPWAKTKMRKYLFGSISIFNDNLEYSGKGGELFKGSLIAFLYLMIFSFLGFLAAFFLLKDNVELRDYVRSGVSYLLIFLLIYYSQYSSLKYRLSKTKWRGINCSLQGKSRNYMFFKFGNYLINILSLGFLISRTDAAAKKYVIENMRTGNSIWRFKGDKEKLNKSNFITLILAIPTLGFSRYWYNAQLKNFTWNSTSVEQISFKANFSGGKILSFHISNILILIFSIGLGIPLILYRTINFYIQNIEIIGDEEKISIIQSKYHQNAVGDGIDDFISDDSDLDLDFGVW